MFSKSHLSQQSPNSIPQESRDLDTNIAQLKEFDERRGKVCKELKKLNDCLNELNSNEKQLLEELNSFTIHDLEKFNLVIDKWGTYLNDVSKNRDDLTTIIARTVIEPLKKFQNGFNEFRSATKRQEFLTSEHQKFSAKVAKYRESERTSTNIIKVNDYQSKLAQAQSDLNTLTSVLERELPMFLQKRIDYFQPSLASLISSEILYSGNNLTALNELHQISQECSEAELQDKQKMLFDSISSLSIIS